LGSATRAFRPERPGVKYDVRVVGRDRRLDLAILEVANTGAYEFEPLVGRDAKIGEAVTVAGYPNWIAGTTLWQASGHVAGTHSYFGVPCYRVTCPIVSGASGAPVFDGYRRVIGVAARGSASVEDGAASADHGVIPIARVFDLAKLLNG